MSEERVGSVSVRVLSVQCELVSAIRETAGLRLRSTRAIGIGRRHGWF